MAYQLSYWRKVDPFRPDDWDEVIKPRKIKRVSEIEDKLRPIPKECDIITLDRTDNQSPVSKVIWERPVKRTK